jgi:hypothetical protein
MCSLRGFSFDTKKLENTLECSRSLAAPLKSRQTWHDVLELSSFEILCFYRFTPSYLNFRHKKAVFYSLMCLLRVLLWYKKPRWFDFMFYFSGLRF